MSPRYVLDTNIVLSALLFTSGRLAWVRAAWQADRLRPVVCRETVQELLRTLAYPKFRLDADAREELLADFLPFAEVITLPSAWPDLPACRDPDDQVFLVLAAVSAADGLVTGDADLLMLSDGGLPPILTAEQLRQHLDESASEQ